MEVSQDLINYQVFTKDNPLIVSRKAVNIAMQQHPELRTEIYLIIKRGIIQVEE